jgi:iron-sulfur cluster repair protein YtfE (RIC family)
MAQQDDATVLLDEDHNEVMRMFEQYKAAKDGSRQGELGQRICQELLVHMQIEEEIFYPAYIEATGDKENLKDGLKEHKEARDLIAQLVKDPKNAKLMLELEDGILHHVNDEREKMFPKARKTQGLDLMALAQELQARKMELMAGNAA